MNRKGMLHTALIIATVGWNAQGFQGGFIETRVDLDSLLGFGSTCADFEDFEVDPGDAVFTGCSRLNCDIVCMGQGPGLVPCPLSINNRNNQFIWLGEGHAGQPSRCPRGRDGLTVAFSGQLRQAIGFELRTFDSARFNTTINVRDVTGAIIDSKVVEVDGVPGVFIGYFHPEGISQIDVNNEFPNTFPIVDDMCFGNALPICDGDEKYKVKCRSKRGKHAVKAVLKKAEPDREITFQLDGSVVVETGTNKKGKAKAKFKGVSAGLHSVEVVECGLKKDVTCDA